ncbi:hypothetical protein CDIK_3900 [Cucumispora dikerogammari]|nr:hypothetical protein CDIK_3900 [Cucumispora dikerogammari]
MSEKRNNDNQKQPKHPIYTRDIIFDYLQFDQYPSSFDKNKKRALRNKVQNMKIIDNKIHQKIEQNGSFKVLFFESETAKKTALIVAEHEKAHFKTEKSLSD